MLSTIRHNCLSNIILRTSFTSTIQRVMSSIENATKRKESDEDESLSVETSPVKLPKKKWKREEDDVLDLRYCETSYYFDGYLRKVYPYYFTYKAYCKRRWIGRKLTDVMTTEFRVLSQESLANKIKIGDIRVNDSVVDVDYVFKDLDRLSSRVHRHELPVLATEMKIIHEDDEFLVVNKPPSLPVHPCGRYRFNSCTALLYKEHGHRNLHIAHRLDRLTSGVLIFCKTYKTAVKIDQEIVNRTVQKEYLCRVEGNFAFDEEVTVDQPLKILCQKIGLSVVSKEDGKESQTTFKKISFNGKSSLVHCKPKTGRTHQIRVHLQFLGYPIINDPLYNSTSFGPNKGKDGNYNGMTHEELVKTLRMHHNIEDWLDLGENTKKHDYDGESDESTISFMGKDYVTKGPSFDPTKVTVDPGCEECHVKYLNPKVRQLMLFLHAWKYSGSDWSFQSDKPFWANDDYDSL